MLIGTVKAAKSNFFDREAVTLRVGRAELKYFRQAGGAVRKTARRSIRPTRQKSLSELTDEERTIFQMRERIAKREDRPRPRRPQYHSKPGQPPRSITGVLKELIFFAFDRPNHTTVVGPAKTNSPSGAPERLEHGASDLEARPFMQPALDIVKPTLPAMWRDLVRV